MNILDRLFRRRASVDAPYYALLKRIFDITPDNIDLYKLALVHKSASVSLDDGGSVNNERLEFLGDSVIQTIVSEMLFIDYPEYNEGSLSKLRSRIVSRDSLNHIALELGLDAVIVAHPSNVGMSRQNLYGDALEALMGALYLDKGYEAANRVLINKVLAGYLDLDSLIHTEHDFKSRIIEWSQKNRLETDFRSRECADHRDLSPHFETFLFIGGRKRGYGDGRSKKEAAQLASRQAYERLVENPQPDDTDPVQEPSTTTVAGDHDTVQESV